MKSKIATALLIMMLAGCGAVPKVKLEDQEAALNTKELCCADLRSIDYPPLDLQNQTKVVLDPTAPARNFPQGRSYFRAYSLPDAEVRGIFIKTYFNGIFIEQYLQPLVLLLNAQHEPIGGAIPRLEFSNGNIFNDNNAHLGGGFRLPKEAKYLIVYTAKFTDAPTPATIEASTQFIMIGPTPVTINSPGKKLELERSMTGELGIQVFVQQNK